VVKLPRAPGAREQRWAQLLCGPVDLSAAPAAAPNVGSLGEDELIAVTRRVAELESTLAVLQDQMQELREQLGLSQPGQS
jgi:uncharacterized protein